MKSTDVIKLLDTSKPMLTLVELRKLGVPDNLILYYQRSYAWHAIIAEELDFKSLNLN